MPYISELHEFFSRLVAITALGPLVLLLAAVAALYYLRLTRQLREQFAIQQRISSHLQKLNTAVEHSPVSILITDRAGVVEYVNPAFCRLTGYGKEEVLGRHTRMLKGRGAAMSPEHYREVWETITAGKEWRGEFFNRRKDGSAFWESASISPIRDATGEITHFVAVKENITERKEMLETLDQLAHYDILTALPNRTLFFDRLNQAISVSHRERQCFALLFTDLDGFKQVNDCYGHEAGDHVLKETARRLSGCVRETDTVARMGGDEFVLILRNLASAGDASLVAQKVLAEVSRPIELPHGERCVVGSSVGISLYPEDSLDAAQLVSAADTAMYAVKRKGKNGYCFYRK